MPVRQTEFYVRNYRARLDGMGDDGPAWQRCLEDMAAKGGGTAVFDGDSAIRSMVAVDFGGRASSVSIRGTVGSRLILSVHESLPALRLAGAERLLLTSFVVTGAPGVYSDGAIGIEIASCFETVIRSVHWYGHRATGPWFDRCANLYIQGDGYAKIEDCTFSGCGAKWAVVGFGPGALGAVSHCKWIDEGRWLGTMLHKADSPAPPAWLRFLLGPGPAIATMSHQHPVLLDRLDLDEGAGVGVIVEGHPDRLIDYVEARGLRRNSNQRGGVLTLSYVREAELRGLWSKSPWFLTTAAAGYNVPALTLNRVERASIVAPQFGAGSDYICACPESGIEIAAELEPQIVRMAA